jgi:hypothetical protein
LVTGFTLILRCEVDPCEFTVVLMVALRFICIQILAFSLLTNGTDVCTVGTVPSLVQLLSAVVAKSNLRYERTVALRFITVTRLRAGIDTVAVETFVVPVDRPVEDVDTDFKIAGFEQGEYILGGRFSGIRIN